MNENNWLALSYHVPMNPSKNRVYIWRKLKEFGAEYLTPGVALLPRSPQNLRKFRSLWNHIRETGGEAVLSELFFLDQEDMLSMVERFRTQSISDYTELLMDCTRLMDDIRALRAMGKAHADDTEGQLRRMLRRFSHLQRRDYFQAGEHTAGATEQGLRDIAKAVRWSAQDIQNQLRKFLEKE